MTEGGKAKMVEFEKRKKRHLDALTRSSGEELQPLRVRSDFLIR